MLPRMEGHGSTYPTRPLHMFVSPDSKSSEKTRTGSCEETAATSVAPVTSEIFADSFESGDTSEWSSKVP